MTTEFDTKTAESARLDKFIWVSQEALVVEDYIATELRTARAALLLLDMYITQFRMSFQHGNILLKRENA